MPSEDLDKRVAPAVLQRVCYESLDETLMSELDSDEPVNQ